MNVNLCYLINLKKWRLYRWFGYLFIKHLYTLFERFVHNIDLAMPQYRTKNCYYCPKHGKSPRKFFFTLKDNDNLNYHIIVNIIYLIASTILHIINKTTYFQATE